MSACIVPGLVRRLIGGSDTGKSAKLLNVGNMGHAGADMMNIRTIRSFEGTIRKEST
jgi:hypothetical protein